MLRRKRSLGPRPRLSVDTLENVIKNDLENAYKSRKYEYMLITFFCVNQMIGAFTYMISEFVFMNPVFTCNNKVTPEPQACKMLPQCTVTPTFTGTYFLDLQCEHQNVRALVQGVFFVGVVMGMGGVAMLSDSKGRRKALLFSYAVQIIAISTLYLGIFYKIIPIVVLGQFLSGFFISTTCVLCFVFTGQFCDDRARQRGILLYCAFWQKKNQLRALSQAMFCIFYYFFNTWKDYLLFIILVPSCIMFVLAWFFILETPHFYLFLKRDIKGFRSIVKSIAKFDQIDMQIVVHMEAKITEYFQAIECSSRSIAEQKSFSKSVKKLVGVKKNLVTCICITLLVSGYNIYYYGMQSSTERTGFNFGISMLIMGSTQFLGYLTTSFFVEKIPRKKGIAVIATLGAGFGLCFLIPGVANSPIAQSICAALIRFFIVSSYSMMCLLQTQSFDIEVESLALGICDGIGQLGNVGVPYLVNLGNNIGIHPAIFSAIFYGSLCIIPLFFITQTNPYKSSKEKKESQTIVHSLLTDPDAGYDSADEGPVYSPVVPKLSKHFSDYGSASKII